MCDKDENPPEQVQPRTKRKVLGELLDELSEATMTYSQAHLHMFVNHLRDKGYMTDEKVLEALGTFNESLDGPVD